MGYCNRLWKNQISVRKKILCIVFCHNMNWTVCQTSHTCNYILIWCIYNSQITTLNWYYVLIYFCSAIRQFVCYIAIVCFPVKYCAILITIHHTISENRNVLFRVVSIATFVVSWITISSQSYHRNILHTKWKICICWL